MGRQRVYDFTVIEADLAPYFGDMSNERKIRSVGPTCHDLLSD